MLRAWLGRWSCIPGHTRSLVWLCAMGTERSERQEWEVKRRGVVLDNRGGGKMVPDRGQVGSKSLGDEGKMEGHTSCIYRFIMKIRLAMTIQGLCVCCAMGFAGRSPGRLLGRRLDPNPDLPGVLSLGLGRELMI